MLSSVNRPALCIFVWPRHTTRSSTPRSALRVNPLAYMRCSVASSWRVAAARLPELARWARREEEKGYLTSMYDPRSICVW